MNIRTLLQYICAMSIAYVPLCSALIHEDVSAHHIKTKKLKVKDESVFEGDVVFEERVKMKDRLSVNDDAHFHEDVEIDEDLVVDGTITASSIEVLDDITVGGDLIVTGTIVNGTGCDIIVPCNLLMRDTIPSGTGFIGIIYKESDIFMHNAGTNNTFLGERAGALLINPTGAVDDTAIGTDAMSLSPMDANFSTAIGARALRLNPGENNIGIGVDALSEPPSAALPNSPNRTIAIGNNAGRYYAGEGSIFIGDNVAQQNLSPSTLGGDNVIIGRDAGTSLPAGSVGNILLGAGVFGDAADTNVIRIGVAQLRTFIAGIFGAAVAGGALPVIVDVNGQLGTVISTKKAKENIQDLENVAEIINKLRPVLFNYISDPSKTEQYGLIAEEVAKICPNLVVYDKDGQPLTVKYHLLDAFFIGMLKKHDAAIKELEAQTLTMQEYQERIMNLESQLAQLKEQLEVIQKVIALS